MSLQNALEFELSKLTKKEILAEAIYYAKDVEHLAADIPAAAIAIKSAEAVLADPSDENRKAAAYAAAYAAWAARAADAWAAWAARAAVYAEAEAEATWAASAAAYAAYNKTLLKYLSRLIGHNNIKIIIHEPYYLIVYNDRIQIGCLNNSIKHWKDDYKTIGLENEIDDEIIEKYGEIIRKLNLNMLY